MLDANKVITHVKKAYDPISRANTYTTETIDGVSWFRTQAQSVTNGVVQFADVIKVRIPTNGRTEMPNIKKGDLLIFGAVDVQGLDTIAKIRNKYQNSCEVQSVTYNLDSAPYSQHIRITGA